MIKLVPILYLLLLSFSTIIAPISNDQTNDAILTTFKNGSSREIAKFMEQSVELNINGNQGEFSKNQAELVLRDFFKKYPPENFEILHESNSGEQIKNYIGTYQSMGEPYRILIKGKIFRDEMRIYSIEIMKY
ncbi:DUF4783 domain-containing protein [Belliella kenyensis]|uniref:DUF4783 domain-containing protein n=1 Tax=Belliella kenyensis TaxID=1472724 RepID=A0ABV8EIR9_9BACT|nr:DUF4783 domain-containing protein [Belliella kenyensis]MCH7401397.1 DUF4783 domain-containing protein [Belliella kenyensis]MDN3602840.1 DUF4783 domain-containing protein [Belliella kenyensis]